MTRRWIAAAVLILAGCGPSQEERARADSAAAATRGAEVAKRLADSTLGPAEPIARWVLPLDMMEISGMALNPDGNTILVHADEMAHIVAVDFRTGLVTRRFDLGENPVTGDFEGITRVGTTYYMMTSKGQIYVFPDTTHGARVVDYTIIDTKLAAECEFEGIGHDPVINALLLPCKVPKKALSDSMVVYRWPLGTNPGAVTRLTVPLVTVIGSNDWDEVSPSDIAVDPTSGNYVIITARENALIVITPNGELISSGAIPTNIAHAEGVAITRDGILVIGAEAGDAPATVTLFRWASGASAPATPLDSVSTAADQPSPVTEP